MKDKTETTKNILLLTPIYPAPDLPYDTPVVHFFVKEWVRLGYNVLVIHYSVNFPKVIHLASNICHSFLESKFASVVRKFQAKENDYFIDGVHVARIPMLKYIPHTRYSKKQIAEAYNKTLSKCKEYSFIPDVIVSHWVNPQLEIMMKLKKYFSVPTCFVAHDSGTDLKTIYNNESKNILESIDLLGYRSDSIKKKFENNFNIIKSTFMCYSGVPEYYLSDIKESREFLSINRFIFVGTLIKRKFPAEILLSLKKSFENDSFQMTYIGEGNEMKQININSKNLNENQKVFLLGKKTRNEVIDKLDICDIFIMISKGETFGLVYLEAMARGCITIASKNEGFDGIIKHGENGFLCEAGNVDELAMLISEIRGMSKEKLKIISNNAINTAQKLTDKKVAKNYINNVIALCQ